MSSYKTRMIRIQDAADVAPPDEAHAVRARNLRTMPLEADYQARDFATGAEGAQPEAVYNYHAGASFEVEAGIPATAGDAPAYAPLLRACGLDEALTPAASAVFSPTPADGTYGSARMAMRSGDNVQQIDGMRGALTFTCEANRKPLFGFDFKGTYGAPVAGSWTTPPFTGWRDAPNANPTNMQAFTLGGTTLCVTQFSFTDGRNVQYGKYANCPTIENTLRRFTGRMTVRWPDLATKDILEQARLGTLEALIFELQDEGSARKLRIAGPKVQIKFAGDADLQGELGATLDLVFIPDQGDDEIAISFL